jgi:uncharacterized protein YjdB
MKKILSFALVAAMIVVALFATVSVSAANMELEGSVTVSSATVAPGDTVTVSFNLTKNTGFMQMNVQFPSFPAVLEFVSVAKGTGIKSVESSNGKSFSVEGGDNDVTTTGTIFTATYTVKNDAAVGNYTVQARTNDAVNYAEDEEAFTFTSASFAVAIAPTSVTADPASVTIDLAGETQTANVTVSVLPTGATANITATSSDSTVATATKDGVITGLKKGTATVTFTQTGTQLSATVAVTVTCSHDLVETASADYLITAGTCNTKAVYCKHCSICGEKSTETFEGEIDANNHNWVETASADYLKTAGNCTTKAVYYKHCSRCGINSTETFEGTVDANNHDWVETASADYLKTAGNCVDKAVYYKHCSRCNTNSTETFEGEKDAHNHKGPITKVGEIPATCTVAGNTGTQTCEACHTVIANGETVNPLNHQPAEQWSTDAEGHWKVCTREGCGQIAVEKVPHTAGEWTVVEAAQIGKEGKEAKTCTVCGYEIETRKIDALVEYKVTEGDKTELKTNALADVTFTTNAEGKAVTGVKVNGTELASDKFTVGNDGKVTVKKDAFTGLEGNVAIEITYADGVAAATVTLTAPQQTPVNPQTGVDSHFILWIVLLVAAVSGISAIVVLKKKESK